MICDESERLFNALRSTEHYYEGFLMLVVKHMKERGYTVPSEAESYCLREIWKGVLVCKHAYDEYHRLRRGLKRPHSNRL